MHDAGVCGKDVGWLADLGRVGCVRIGKGVLVHMGTSDRGR